LRGLHPPTLTDIKTQDGAGRQMGAMANLVFICPQTGMNVQLWLADEAGPGPRCTYEIVICNACSRIHFIDPSTGKLFGAQKE
jgi:hypothetical protein